MIMRLDSRTPSSHADLAGDHDAGLEHNHHWACERIAARKHTQTVHDTSIMRTPSSALHDDALYG